MKKITSSSAIALTALALLYVPAKAQTSVSGSSSSSQSNSNTTVIYNQESELQRAENLARQAAEKANGGINQYQAEPSMYGPPTETPHVDNGNGTWTFTFKGGSPGYTTPTVESVVTVAKKDWKVTVNYNGPIRSTTKMMKP